jgi:uncharacterized membrane protein HdeD (DUF308 family)
MTTVVVEEVELEPPPPRWISITAGILWLIVGLVLLSLDSTSAATLGYMVGFVLILAGVDEFVHMIEAAGWKWLHGLMGVVFVLGGFFALLSPFHTFGILALFIGWFLIIKGFFDVAESIGFRHVMPLWGLSLAAGIAQIALGLWAVGYPGRSAWLLLVWTGVGALMRSVGSFVTAFASGGR